LIKTKKTIGLTRSTFLRWTRNAILLSVTAHLAFAIVAGFIIAIRTYHKPQATFQGDPPPRPRLEPQKLEMKVKIQDMQKRSSRPKLQPRLAAMTPSEVAIPEIKKLPKQTDQRIQRNVATVGVSGFGQGIGGGLGSGMGGGISFFGLKGVGQRHLFVVDLSMSMSAQQLNTLKQELVKSLKELRPGMSYQVICFAGPVWFLGDTFIQKQPAGGTYIVGDASGKRHEWTIGSGPADIRFKGGINNLPRASWRVASPANIQESVNMVQAWTRSDLVFGTTWIWPMRVALQMQPPAEVIYFMTDGVAQRMPESVEEITELNKRHGAVINTVSMISEKKEGNRWLNEMAKQNKGNFVER